MELFTFLGSIDSMAMAKVTIQIHNLGHHPLSQSHPLDQSWHKFTGLKGKNSSVLTSSHVFLLVSIHDLIFIISSLLFSYLTPQNNGTCCNISMQARNCLDLVHSPLPSLILFLFP